MAALPKNVSFDGSPVQLQLDSPYLVCLDPLGLEWVRDQLKVLDVNGRTDIGLVLDRVNANDSLISCYQISDFQPGIHTLNPCDIRKFGDEDEELDYDDKEDEQPCGPLSFPFVAVDSGTLIFADFAHLSDLVDIFTWEQYDLALQDDTLFGRITNALGGPFFAVIAGGCMPGMEFDGDGTYTVKEGAVKPIRS